MASKLQQMQMSFNPEQDRILLRLRGADASEVRLWLTRRYVRHLWGTVTRLVENAEPAAGAPLPGNPGARDAVLAFRHQAAVGRADFSAPYAEEAPRALPLGETPVLLSRLGSTSYPDGRRILSLHPAQGVGIDLELDDTLLHSFAKLLYETVARSEWQLKLTAPWMQPETTAAASASIN